MYTSVNHKSEMADKRGIGSDIYDLQREQMAAEVAKEKRRPPQTGTQYPPVRQPGPAEQYHTGAAHRRPPLAAVGAPPPGFYRPGPVDIKEIQKQAMFGSASPLEDDHFEKNRPAAASVYGVSDQYLVLDSYVKRQDSLTNLGRLDFNFMVQGSARCQSVATSDTLENVIEIQAGEFCIPLLGLAEFDPAALVALEPGLAELGLAANGALPGGDAVVNTRTQVPFCRRVTLHLQEVGRQAFIDHKNKMHHFEFGASVPAPGDRILLTPLGDCCLFQFTDPIKELQGLSLRFNNPDYHLALPPDCIYGAAAVSDAGQLLQFNYTDPDGLGNLAVDDRIYIDGFSSGFPILDRYISRPDGHLVGAGGFVANTQFRLNPDVSVAAFVAANTPIPSSTPITVCIAKNRIRIPLRIRRVVGRLTNYKSP